MICENCNLKHEGNYGSGRFCTEKCARGFSTKLKRNEINNKVSEVLKGRISNFKGKKGKNLTEQQYQKQLEGIKRHCANLEKVSDSHKKALNTAKVMAYRARKKKAITFDADLSLIKLIYENCPPGYHVDHIHALARGGLHHQDNLQYLPGSENCRKCADRDYDKSKAIDWRSIIIKVPIEIKNIPESPNW